VKHLHEMNYWVEPFSRLGEEAGKDSTQRRGLRRLMRVLDANFRDTTRTSEMPRWCPVSEVRNKTRVVILSERGPKRFSAWGW
jgi:hypothetical protein